MIYFIKNYERYYMKVLLVEDDKKFNNAICEYLIYKDFKIISSSSGRNILDKENFDEYSLCIISIDISDIDGLELLKKIKEKSNTPTIIISSSDDISKFEKSFYYSCDDYIKKPFHLKELELRIYKTLGLSHVINIHDDLIFNLKTFNLYYKDNLVKLRKKEKSLLNILVSNRGKVVPKSKIIDYVWSDDEHEEYPVRQLISNLRDKLPANIIETEVGLGYKIS